jgi:hypothetical protein
VVGPLVQYLGCILIEEMTGATGADLRRWLEGGFLNIDQEARLRTGHKALQIVAEVDGAFVARAWMIGMDPHLGDECPLVLIRQGRGRDVLVAARAYVNG